MLAVFVLLLPWCGKIKIYRVDQKTGRRLTTIILSNIYRFIIFLTGRFLSKFAVKWESKIPPHLTYVATVPCNLSSVACFADINVSQGSVATFARCSGTFNIHLTANLPRNLSVNFF